MTKLRSMAIETTRKSWKPRKMGSLPQIPGPWYLKCIPASQNSGATGMRSFSSSAFLFRISGYAGWFRGECEESRRHRDDAAHQIVAGARSATGRAAATRTTTCDLAIGVFPIAFVASAFMAGDLGFRHASLLRIDPPQRGIAGRNLDAASSPCESQWLGGTIFKFFFQFWLSCSSSFFTFEFQRPWVLDFWKLQFC